MRRSMILSVFCALLLLSGGVGTASAAETTTVAGQGDLVVLDVYQQTGTEVVRFVNPESGRMWDWPLRKGMYLFGAAAGSPGIVYVGIGDGHATTVYAVEAGSLSGMITPVRIGAVPGRASIWKLSDDGLHLLVLTFPGKPDDPRGMPTRLTRITLPASTRAASNRADSAATAVWYDLVQPAGQPVSPTSRHLWRATLREGQKPELQDTGVQSSGYYSVLPAPDGRAVYLVDYFNQKIVVVDSKDLGVERTITFGDHPFKRPPCGASLSGDGNRLYVLSNLNNNTTSGILVYDTHSWQRLTHFPNPDHASSYCIGVSPDGQRFFVTSDGALVTLDARTGAEINRVTFDDADNPPMLVLTTTAGK